MNHKKNLVYIIGAIILLALISGCGAPESEQQVEEPIATILPTESVQEEIEAELPSQTPLPKTLSPITPLSEPPTPIVISPSETSIPALTISSTAFEHDDVIPKKYSCLGDNLSPALEWSGVPADAQSLVLLVYDVDAGLSLGSSTELGFAHWIVYNIPPSSIGYPEDMPAGSQLGDGALQGSNDFNQFESPGSIFPGGAAVKLIGYDGPCPPSTHRYAFAIYALDISLDIPGEANMSQILGEMSDHILSQAELVASFDPSQ